MRNVDILDQVVKELDKGICKCPTCGMSLGWDDVDTVDDDEGYMLEIFCLNCMDDDGILWSIDWADDDYDDDDEDRFTDPDYVIDHIDEACGWG